MINKYKENTKHYIKCCCCCRSQFTFQYEDIKNGRIDNNNYGDYVVCPYCDERNKVGTLLKPTKKDYHSDLINIEKFKIEIENKEKEIKEYKNKVESISSKNTEMYKNLQEKIEHEKHNNNVLENKMKDFITKNKKLNETVNAYSIHFSSKKGNISKQELLDALNVISEGIEVE